MLLIDCHAHIYDQNRVVPALQCAMANLRRLALSLPDCAGPIFKAIVLTDTVHTRSYTHLLGRSAIGPFRIQALAGGSAVLVQHSDYGELVLFPAVQLNTSEGLEVQLLFKRAEHSSFARAPLSEIVASARDTIPIIPWAPGKWLFSRRKVLEALLSEDGGKCFLADSSMRPRWTPLPPLLRRANSAGRFYLAGSDPLPLPGEERLIGTYATLAPRPLDLSSPVESLRDALLQPIRTAGSRCLLPSSCSRWLRHRLQKLRSSARKSSYS